MKASTILNAIEVLSKVDSFLSKDANYKPGAPQLSVECYLVILDLKAELVAHLPKAVKVQDDSEVAA